MDYKIMDYKLIKLAKRVLRLINEILPKNPDLWIFVSIPDYSDNAKALFEYMKKKHPQIRKVWLCYDGEYAKKLREKGIKAYPHFSINGIWNFLRAKVLITTHNDYLSMKSGDQYFVSLWHGIPIKTIGFKDEVDKQLLEEHTIKKIDLLVATSSFTRTMFSSIFHLPKEKIIIAGLPRNDKIYSSRPCPHIFEKITGVHINDSSSIILYAPTYRTSEKRTEIHDIKEVPLYSIIKHFNKLDSFLKKYNAYLLLKLHPLEEDYVAKYLEDVVSNRSRIRIIRSNILRNYFIDLYDILPCVDILITDYSSIYLDFLLKKQPIVYFISDISSYKQSRGFILEPYEKWTPGIKAYDLSELFEALENLFLNSTPKIIVKNRRQHKKLKYKFHEYSNGNACERIVSLILSRVQGNDNNMRG